MSVVIDTDVVSFVFKHDTRAELYRKHLSSFPYFISFMTLAEMRRWTLTQNWGAARRTSLEKELSICVVVLLTMICVLSGQK